MATDAGENFDYIVTGMVRLAAPSPIGSADQGSIACCCWKLVVRTAIRGFTFRWASPACAPIRVNWICESEPEPQLHGRALYQPRGKVLGGSSSINAMVYMRGNAADYDEWRQRGCGWDWISVLPYFKKAESPGTRRQRIPQRRRSVARVRSTASLRTGRPISQLKPRSVISGPSPPIGRLQRMGGSEGAGYFRITWGKVVVGALRTACAFRHATAKTRFCARMRTPRAS